MLYERRMVAGCCRRRQTAFTRQICRSTITGLSRRCRRDRGYSPSRSHFRTKNVFSAVHPTCIRQQSGITTFRNAADAAHIWTGMEQIALAGERPDRFGEGAMTAQAFSGDGRGRLHRLGGGAALDRRRRSTASWWSTSSPMPAISTRLAPVAASPRYAFVQADICDLAADARRIGRVPARRRHAPRRREPCRPLDRRARRLHRDQRRRHLRAAARRRCDYWRGLPTRPRGAFRFHHVSTDEVFGSLGPDGPVHARRRPTSRTRPIRRRRRRPTISCAPGTTPTACRP